MNDQSKGELVTPVLVPQVDVLDPHLDVIQQLYQVLIHGGLLFVGGCLLSLLEPRCELLNGVFNQLLLGLPDILPDLGIRVVLVHYYGVDALDLNDQGGVLHP